MVTVTFVAMMGMPPSSAAEEEAGDDLESDDDFLDFDILRRL
jgi:hypothetical protein